ncbi:hypothetical protein niasHS_008008 [Heterodera schachtii]|uniref:Uncharacterized protein n=1 Tax=Heterodera schachtii TaxID=97005 RepID=A0ABD2JCM3_HETSC
MTIFIRKFDLARSEAIIVSADEEKNKKGLGKKSKKGIQQLKCQLARKLAGVAAERRFCVATLYEADDDEVEAEELADAAEGSDAGQLMADARANAEAFVRANSAWIEWMAIELFKRKRISRWNLIRKFGHAVSEGTIEVEEEEQEMVVEEGEEDGEEGAGEVQQEDEEEGEEDGEEGEEDEEEGEEDGEEGEEDEEEGEEDGEEGEEMEWE